MRILKTTLLRVSALVGIVLVHHVAPAESAQLGLWTGKIEARQETMSADGSAEIVQTVTINARLREVEKVALVQLPIKNKLTDVIYDIVLSSEGSRLSATYTRTGTEPCSAVRTGISNEDRIGSIQYRAVSDSFVDAELREIPREGMARIFFSDASLQPWEIRCGQFDVAVVTPELQVRTNSEVLNHFTPISRNLTVIEGERIDERPGGYREVVRWNLCRQGSRNCITPPEGQVVEKCPKPTVQQALLEARLNEQNVQLQRLKKVRDEYVQLGQEARQWEGDYASVSRDCMLFTAAKFLGSLLVGNFAPKIPGAVLPAGPGRAGGTSLPDVEAGKALVNFLNFVEKLYRNDASWILPNTEYEGWVSAEDVWDGMKAGYEGLQSMNATPAEMRKSMLSCGAPSIAGAIEGALQYLSLLDQMLPLQEEMNLILNNVRQIDIDIAGDEWPKYRDACIEYEQCREGGDPARCDQWPPP